ncbi:MAG: HEAT repeat domain-containing protein [Chloroflexi bacterium]|nr:HEAT repeat domain-containing protein [Chloroflexota bacterium]
MLAFLIQGGGNELLDYVDTDAYWRIQGVEITDALLIQQLNDAGPEDVSALIAQLGHSDFEKREAAMLALREAGRGALPQLRDASESDDPEVAMRVRGLIAPLEALQASSPVTRLMAIRTLGERRVESAGPVLKRLTDSEDTFVGEYAARALALIEAKPYDGSPPDDAALARDLRRLPAPSAAVVQSRFEGYGALDIAAQLDRFGQDMAAQRQPMMDQITRQVLKIAGEIGNARIEAITAGAVPADEGKGVELIVIARGLYDRDRLVARLSRESEVKRKHAGLEFHMLGGDEIGIAAVSDRELIVCASFASAPLLHSVGDHLRTPPDALPFAEALTALVESAGKADPMMAALVLPDEFRADDAPFSVIEKVVLSATRQVETQSLKITGFGQNAEALAQIGVMIKEGIDTIRTQLAAQPQMAAARPEVMDVLKAVIIESHETSVSLSIALPLEDGKPSISLSPLMFLFGGGMSVLR